jgi:hypothetical protein
LSKDFECMFNLPAHDGVELAGRVLVKEGYVLSNNGLVEFVSHSFDLPLGRRVPADVAEIIEKDRYAADYDVEANAVVHSSVDVRVVLGQLEA